jgi:ubiquinone/menaquinone biosynthesis C-methylase UbiE
MPSSYLKCFFDGVVPTGNAGNLRGDDYSYPQVARRLIKNLNITKKDSLLDIGCGNGLMADQLVNYVGKLTIVDANPYLVKYLREKYEGKDLNVALLSSTDLTSYPNETFDKVICIAVLQYCDEEEAKKTVSEALRVCKTGGLIYFGDVLDATVYNTNVEGMNSFSPKNLIKGYKYKTLISSFEPYRRYDLVIQK